MLFPPEGLKIFENKVISEGIQSDICFQVGVSHHMARGGSDKEQSGAVGVKIQLVLW